MYDKFLYEYKHRRLLKYLDDKMMINYLSCKLDKEEHCFTRKLSIIH